MRKKRFWRTGISNHNLKVFVLDVETTRSCRKRGRIIEIAIRGFQAGKNSRFCTLINPEIEVPNSYIQDMTTQMMTYPGNTRMEDEFKRCSYDISSLLAIPGHTSSGRERRPKVSLEGLSNYYGIPRVGSVHMAMSDVNLLSSIFERMAFDLHLTFNDHLWQRCFKSCGLNIKT
ncbi:hypothetical protein FEM48_Zijuj12G0199000 [Ziziphus jujuba var. spinosa]|uniref:Exonuclease domain-containing protein n=1 Tax=Ziziphus jujuba var. spinosa TaxID=714518 RepID=A0A978UF86_ZIZJJ|nr:hypothetical protein FEM48_Zijuj12G0199000 [Ziziphus jujuba var. spinosa]